VEPTQQALPLRHSKHERSCKPTPSLAERTAEQFNDSHLDAEDEKEIDAQHF